MLEDFDTAAEEDPGLLNPDLLCPSDDSTPPLVDSSRRPYGSYAADCLDDDDGGVLLLDLYVSLANDVSWLFFDGFSATVLVTETDDVEDCTSALKEPAGFFWRPANIEKNKRNSIEIQLRYC